MIIEIGNYNLYEKINYPAGEIQIRIRPHVIPRIQKAREVLVFGRDMTHERIIEVRLLLDALAEILKTTVKNKVRLIFPYLPYSRADRRFCGGDCFGLKVFLNMFPWHKITTVDMHPQASSLTSEVDNYAGDLFIAYTINDIIRDTGCKFINILLPDEGARTRYRIRDNYGYNQAAAETRILNCTKNRDPITGKLSGFGVPAADEFLLGPVLIVDDICDGGGTFLGIADTLELASDHGLFLHVTHGIFSKGTGSLLRRFDKIFSTTSFTHEVGGVKRRDITTPLIQHCYETYV